MYNLRGSINIELNRAGVSHLDQRYLTGRGTNDILNEYVALDPHGKMPKYFRTIEPLLRAMWRCANELELQLNVDGIDAATNRQKNILE